MMAINDSSWERVLPGNGRNEIYGDFKTFTSGLTKRGRAPINLVS